jgi:hypothetical protein
MPDPTDKYQSFQSFSYIEEDSSLGDQISTIKYKPHCSNYPPKIHKMNP